MKLEPLQYGAVTYVDEVEDGKGGTFEVTFLISCTDGEDSLQAHHQFVVERMVPAEGRNQSYEEVENAAAQALPVFFRSLADALEADTAEVSARRKAHESSE